MSSLKKRVNVVLSNGLCVVSAKFRKDAPVVTLFITDYTNDTRVMFDIESKRILANRDNIELTANDIDNLCAVLLKKEMPVAVAIPPVVVKVTERSPF